MGACESTHTSNRPDISRDIDVTSAIPEDPSQEVTVSGSDHVSDSIAGHSLHEEQYNGAENLFTNENNIQRSPRESPVEEAKAETKKRKEEIAI